jgi:hypothetical protein
MGGAHFAQQYFKDVKYYFGTTQLRRYWVVLMLGPMH